MSDYTVRIHDGDTVKDIAMPADEIEQYEADAKRAAAAAKAAAAKEAAKKSAVAKLAALGLSEDEAKALLGV